MMPNTVEPILTPNDIWLTLLLLDRRWSDHLALIEDIREGIHLQRYGGREPLTEFQRQIIDAYAAMMEGLRDEVVERVDRLNLPSYTAFVMPKLEPVHDVEGEIVDVAISYPCDLTKQMLEYSTATRHLR